MDTLGNVATKISLLLNKLFLHEHLPLIYQNQIKYNIVQVYVKLFSMADVLNCTFALYTYMQWSVYCDAAKRNIDNRQTDTYSGQLQRLKQLHFPEYI